MVPIPFTVIGGYLGAGKTTLLNALLRQPHQLRMAVLVNDFGAVDIDADLIIDHNGTTISLANGCVCCSLTDGFMSALRDVRAVHPALEHVVVEASGVANPEAVAQWGHSPGFELDGVVVVVDAVDVRARANDRYIGDTIRAQLAAADVLIANKLPLASGSADEITAWLQLHSNAPVFAIDAHEVPAAIVLGHSRRIGHDEGWIQRSPETHAVHHTAASRTTSMIDRRRLDRALAQPVEGFVRLKGIMQFDDTPDLESVVHVVGRRIEITERGTWPPGAESRVVAIAHGGVNPRALQAWIDGITASPCPDR